MKIEWNQVTWYSKILALILLVTLPFVGFYIGTIYQKVANNTQPQSSSPSVKSNLNQKVKITGRIDIHTSGVIYACPANNINCEQPKGTVFLQNVNKPAEAEIELAQGSVTNPTAITCQSTTTPITTCAGYTNGNLTELEGTLVYFHGTYMLVL